MQNRFVELVLEAKKRGATVLLSSHLFEEVERTCGRAAILRAGRLVAVEPVEALRRGRPAPDLYAARQRRGCQDGRRLAGRTGRGKPG